MRRTADRILLLAAFGLATGLAWLATASWPARATDVLPVAECEREPAASAPISLGLEAVEEELGSRRPGTAPAAHGGQACEGRPESVGGQLSIRAVDAASGDPLNRIRVRALGGARFADRESGRGRSELELALSPDAYSLLVLSRGYEAAEPPSVQIETEQIVRLDSVRLRAGSAHIEGILVGELQPDSALWVELSGDGRRPCAACGTASDASGWTREEPCPHCGFSDQLTRRPVAPGGRFVFDGLASGRYALRLVEEHGNALGQPKRIELREAQSLPVELAAACSRVVRVEVVDSDGVSLAREWAERLRRERAEYPEGMMLVFEEGGAPPPLEFQCAVRLEDGILARSGWIAPPSDPKVAGIVRGISCCCGGCRIGGRSAGHLDDRPRCHLDGLRPEIPAPEFRPSLVSGTLDEDGLARLEPLPSTAQVLEMTCGPFSAKVEIPDSRAATTVRALFHRSNPPRTEDGDRTLREFESDPRR